MAHRDPKNKEIKKKRRSTKKQKHMACHVFVETIHVVAAPHVFACMVYLRRSRIVYVSLKSVQEFWSHRGSKFALFIYFVYWILQHLLLTYMP